VAWLMYGVGAGVGAVVSHEIVVGLVHAIMNQNPSLSNRLSNFSFLLLHPRVSVGILAPWYNNDR